MGSILLFRFNSDITRFLSIYFLKANNVIIGSEENKVANTKELAKIGIPATVQLYCLNTKAAHKKNKENKRYGDVMLEKVIDLK